MCLIFTVFTPFQSLNKWWTNEQMDEPIIKGRNIHPHVGKLFSLLQWLLYQFSRYHFQFYSERFLYNSPFILHNNAMFIFFNTGGNWELERLSKLSTCTLLLQDRAVIWTQILFTPKPMALKMFYFPALFIN